MPPVAIQSSSAEAIDVPPVQSLPTEVEAIDMPPVQSLPTEVEAIDMPPVQSSPAEVEAIDVPPVQSSPAEVETLADSSLSALVPPTSPPPQSLSGVSSGMIGVSGFCSSGSDTENESTSNICIDKCDDIGLLLRSMPQTSICKLPPEKKYSIFVNHFRPGESYKFPSRPLDGCNRACQYKYLKSNPHFVYSKAEDGIYCLPCVLFANSSDFSLGQFVREKFNHWTKKNLRFSSHNSKQYHQVSLTHVESLKHSINVPSSTIDMRITKISSEDIARNQLIIKSIADAVLFCGRQNIALSGHRDDRSSEECNNRGNFLALLDYGIKSGNETLKKHLEEAKRNAVYTSKTTQNQLIECIGDHIRDGILKDIKLAKWYSILCDEVVDVSRKEQVSIVLRFVDDTDTIREEFLDFVTVDRITGEVLSNKLKEMVVQYGLELKNCHGQGYDGATNMSGEAGVQGRLTAENPKALYVHCNSHILNLCIVQACSIQAIRNMNSTITETAYFFANSAKRQHFLEMVIDKTSRIVKVKDLCRTRWIYRHEAYENFYVLFEHVIAVMVAITERDMTYGDMNWDSNTIVSANGLLKMFQSFVFILSFVVTMNAMAIIKPVSIKLQHRTSDIVYAYGKIKDIIDELSSIRSDDAILHGWFVQAETLASEVDVVPQVPRTTGRQIHRDNVEHASAEEYFRRTVVIPFLDNLLEQLRERFGSTQMMASKLMCLVPSVICSVDNVNYKSLVEFYEEDLPNSALVATEILRWKAKWERQCAEDRPSTLKAAIDKCDRDFYPNVHMLLRLGCTLPVTSCENERANSTLKNLKTFIRSSMGQVRLSSLALMHVHYDSPVDLKMML